MSAGSEEKDPFLEKLMGIMRNPPAFLVSEVAAQAEGFGEKRAVYAVVGVPLWTYNYAIVLKEDVRYICYRCEKESPYDEPCDHIKAVMRYRVRGLKPLRDEGELRERLNSLPKEGLVALALALSPRLVTREEFEGPRGDEGSPPHED